MKIHRDMEKLLGKTVATLCKMMKKHCDAWGNMLH